ncbi:hypothetical protein VTN49DRAFT_4517 [Thermomyces lanuginosus]|uniref:uncharacterized protein n=1 Tax=Thermomyces lanuginosus TaxID=5541 RepID=UPI0037433A5D
MIISGPTPNGFRASLHIITDIQVTGMMPVDDLEAQLDFRAHNGHELLLHGFVEFEEHSMYLMMKKAGHNWLSSRSTSTIHDTNSHADGPDHTISCTKEPGRFDDLPPLPSGSSGTAKFPPPPSESATGASDAEPSRSVEIPDAEHSDKETGNTSKTVLSSNSNNISIASFLIHISP